MSSGGLSISQVRNPVCTPPVCVFVCASPNNPCVPPGSVVNLTSFQWRVGSSKDMDVSNIFMMSLYVEGGTEIMANSHYFNISSRSTDSGSSTTSSSTVSSSATSSTSVSLAAPTSTGSSSETTASAAATTSTPAAASSGNLSKEAMIGMGVAIPCAVILGIAAGWFFFGRRRKNQQPKPVDHAPDYESNAPAMSTASPGQSRHSNAYTGTTQNGQFYGAVPRHGSPPAEMTGHMQKSPVELQQGWRDYELSGESRPPTGPHYELYAQVPERQTQERYA